jgi:RHH-type transcriptional regulator, proline utilization regulon repressor / proline dehydrogenase / delta 1-pyrroline-5-carboxylate dehydrogenase
MTLRHASSAVGASGVGDPAPGAFHNEPPLDFSLDENRQAFGRALNDARASFPIEAPLIIGGREAATGERIAVPSPSDTSLHVGASASAGAEDARRAIDAAAGAFPAWAATPAGRRASILIETARLIRRRRVELAALEVFEAGKPWREADADVCEAIDFLEYYARQILRLDRPQALQPEILGERNELRHIPLGVVGVIGPWNFPMAIPVGMMSAAVAAGNTVVWKPAEQTPLVVFRVMQLLGEAGLPAGVVNFLPGRGETAGKALVDSPEVRMIAFTGSKAVGLAIIAAAGRVAPGQCFVKRVVAEMGGKNAIVVDATADLDAATPDILYSAFGYSGQKCSACSRLIVHERVADALIARLRDAVESLSVAPAWDPGCQLGPLIDAEARDRVQAYRELGRSEGRVLVETDPGPLAGQGHFVGAGVYEVDDPSARLAREEIFGPVLTVIRAADFPRALEIANSSDYALTGGVFSRTPAHLEMAKSGMACGNLYLNRSITGSIVGRQPFGGYRLSGVGRKAGGPDYLTQFLQARTLTENLMRQGFAPLDGASAD